MLTRISIRPIIAANHLLYLLVLFNLREFLLPLSLMLKNPKSIHDTTSICVILLLSILICPSISVELAFSDTTLVVTSPAPNHAAQTFTFKTYTPGATITGSSSAKWVWDGIAGNGKCNMDITVQKNFTMKCLGLPINISISVDNYYEATLNGQQILTGNNYNVADTYTLATTSYACNQTFTLVINAHNNVSLGTNCSSNQPGILFAAVSQDCPAQPYQVLVDCVLRNCSEILTGCTTCTSSTVCTACSTSQNFVLSTNVCVCASGYVMAGSTCALCSTYMAGCTTCTSTSVCTACNTAQNYQLSINTCRLCSQLMVGCTACSSSSVCTTCNTSQNFVLVSSTKKCACATGYALNGQVCTPCSSLINGCTACSSPSVCTTCNSVQFFTLSGSTCICSASYVLVNSNCVTCNTYMAGCTSCSSQTVCTSCNTTQGYTLSSGSCICSTGYVMINSACQTCSSLIPGCLSCSNSTNCISCNTTQSLSLDPSGQCVCASGYALLSSTCTLCSTLMSGCLTCSSSTICTSCNATAKLQLSGSQCVCSGGYYKSNGNCQTCANSNNACVQCSSMGACIACNDTLHLQLSGNGKCVCQSGYYFTSGGNCLSCNTTVVGCLQCSNSQCTLCDSSKLFFLSNASCACPAGYFISTTSYSCENCTSTFPNCISCIQTTCQTCATTYALTNTGQCSLCSSFMTGCLECSTNTTCTLCDTQIYYLDSSTSTCLTCSIVGCTTCVSGSECAVCAGGYFIDANKTCSMCNSSITGCIICNYLSICSGCSVGYTLSSTNTSCFQCSQILPNCLQCSSPTSCIKCQTGFNLSAENCVQTNLTISLTSLVKDPLKNAVTATLNITPTLNSSFNTSQLNDLFSITPNQGLNISYSVDPLTGIVSADIAYNSTIQDKNFTITYTPPGSNGSSSVSLRPVSLSFIVDPQNNLAAVINPEDSYKLVQYLEPVVLGCAIASLFAMCVALFSAKFIGVEMTAVLQLSFLGLATLDLMPPTFASLLKLMLSNGLNSLFSSSSSTLHSLNPLPPRFNALGFESSLSFNFNIMAAVMFSPVLFSMVCFLLGKVIKRYETTLDKIGWNVLCEYLLTTVLFCLYQAITSACIFGLFQKTASTLFSPSLAIGALVCFLIVAAGMFYWQKPQNFSDFKKTGFAEQHQLYYFIPTAVRILLPVLIITLGTSSATGFACGGICLFMAVLVAIKKPYRHCYNNWRVVFNEISTAIILSSYSIVKMQYGRGNSLASDSILINLISVVDAVLIALVVLVNMVIMVKFIYDKWKMNKGMENLKPEEVKGLDDEPSIIRPLKQEEETLAQGFIKDNKARADFKISQLFQKSYRSKSTIQNPKDETSMVCESVREKNTLNSSLPMEQISVSDSLSQRQPNQTLPQMQDVTPSIVVNIQSPEVPNQELKANQQQIEQNIQQSLQASVRVDQTKILSAPRREKKLVNNSMWESDTEENAEIDAL